MGAWALDFVNGVDSGQGGEWSVSIATSSVAVVAATNAVNCQITTSSPHGLGVGDHIHFRNIVGMIQLNSTQDQYETGTIKRVHSVIDAYTLTLDIDSTSFGSYVSGGTLYHTGVGRCNPTHVRVPGHNFVENELIYVTAVAGAPQVNNYVYKCKNVTPNAVQLYSLTDAPVLGGGFSPYTSGGNVKAYRRLVTSITKASPAVLTVKGHGFLNGQVVFLSGGDMTEITNRAITVANVTSDTFEAQGIDSTLFTTYTGGCWARRPALSNKYLQQTIPVDVFPEGEEILVRATTDPVHRTSASCTWTAGDHVVQTSSSFVGVIAIGDLIGRQLLGGNGELERFYRVDAVSATSITLRTRYYGSSGTDTNSVYHLALSSIPAAGENNAFIIANTRNCIIKGGYDSTFQNQSGQTWLKHAFSFLGSSNGGVFLGVGSVDRINITNCYYCFYNTSNGGSVSNSSFIFSAIYTGYSTEACSLSNCIFAGNNNNSYPSFYDSSNNPISYSNVHVWGATNALATSIAVQAGSSFPRELDGAGLKPVCAGRGISFNTSNWSFKNITADRCYYSFYCGSTTAYNFLIDSCIIENPVSNGYNLYIGTQINSGVIRNVNFRNQSILVLVSQSTGIIFENCTFENYNIGVSVDQYSGSLLFANCDFKSPTNFGVNIANNTVKDIRFLGCSIDAGLEDRKFNLINTDSFYAPNYTLDNSFGISGNYYGRISAISDTSNYVSSPPSLHLVLNTSVNRVHYGVSVVSEWVRAAVGRKFKFKMKRGSTAFTGTITPVFYLNGIRKNTITGITSLSETWTEYEFDCPAGSIDSEGHLELKFEIVGNASSLWIDDFQTEDL